MLIRSIMPHLTVKSPPSAYSRCCSSVTGMASTPIAFLITAGSCMGSVKRTVRLLSSHGSTLTSLARLMSLWYSWRALGSLYILAKSSCACHQPG